MKTQTVKLATLRPGHEYPGESVNSRQTYRDTDLQQLAAQLKEEGQLKPLLVCTHPAKPGVAFVFDGNRRLAAFGTLADCPEIEVKDFGEITPAEALRKSMIANDAVLLHPADRAETFAKLNKDQPPEEIAAKYGMTVKAVQQSIALGGALAPEIIADWRAGILPRETVEIFTLGDTHETQLAAYAWAKEQWAWKHSKRIDQRELRKRLTRNKEAVMTRLLAFVGVDAYRGAGGIVTEDFFGSGGVVQDMRILNKMAKAKLEAEVERLTADGWSWVEAKLTPPSWMSHGYGEIKITPKLTAEEKKRLKELEDGLKKMNDRMYADNGDDAGDQDDENELEVLEQRLDNEKETIEVSARLRAIDADDKKRSGVLLSLNDDGSFHHLYGLIKRAESKKKGSGSGYSYERQEPDVSYNVTNALEAWVNGAAAALLVKKPKEAFTLYCAAIAVGGGWDQPMRTSGGDDKPVLKGKTFDAAYAELSKLTLDKAVALLAPVFAGCVNIGERRGKTKHHGTVLKVIGEQAFADELAKRFDAKVYFSGCSKQHVLGCIKEALGEAARKNAEGGSEASLRTEAALSIPKTGWLPPELRTSLYKAPKPAPGDNVAELKKPAAKAKLKKPCKKMAKRAA